MNIAKDKNGEEIPTKMFNGGIKIEEDMIPESFAEHFSNKILRIGKNILANRMMVLNKLIDLDWLNLSLNTFKLKVKELFLTN